MSEVYLEYGRLYERRLRQLEGTDTITAIRYMGMNWRGVGS